MGKYMAENKLWGKKPLIQQAPVLTVDKDYFSIILFSYYDYPGLIDRSPLGDWKVK